jgi:UDP-GlcNAc:undecaprenyl-phosphate/decaprenyl-phosphate GlcNAc-1-phosphate transferase
VTWLLVGAVLPSLVVSCLAALWIRRAAPGWGLVDQPGQRKVHTAATPLGGGIAIWLGVVVPLAAGQVALWTLQAARADPSGAGFLAGLRLSELPLPEIVERNLGGLAEQAPKLWLILGAATVLMVLGLLDDRRGLSWRLRLTVELAVAIFVVWRGWRVTLYIDAPWLTGALSVLWIVGLVNSFNMLDNMDGLSAGVAAIAAAMLAAVLLVAPDPETHGPQLFVAGFLLLLVGSLLGFLWHNRPPARLFMGDAGSYFIGFCLAVATIMATFTGGSLPRHSILAPVCVLAVPLYDTLTVVAIRLRQGRSPFEADKNHFSHRLTDLGMTKTQAVLTIYLTTATCGLGALLLYQVNVAGAAVIVLLVGCVLALVGVLETTVRRGRRNGDP